MDGEQNLSLRMWNLYTIGGDWKVVWEMSVDVVCVAAAPRAKPLLRQVLVLYIYAMVSGGANDDPGHA